MNVDGVDLAALAGWMDAQGLGGGPIVAAERLAGGSTYILLRLGRDGRDYVLRLPPERKRRGGDEAMRREARVLRALAGSDVPHPALIAACPTPDVLGAAFYLMEFVDGANVLNELPERYRVRPEWQARLGLSIVDGFAALGSVAVEGAGLGAHRSPADWADGQIDRWRTRLRSCAGTANYPGPPVPYADQVAAWLQRTRPADCRLGLVHGDPHIGNLMIRREAPELAAIVDWELAGVGDPLLDLAHLLAVWPGTPAAFWLSTPLPGLPAPDVLAHRYALRTGRDLEDLDWFAVLARYRLGVILEGSRARMLAGLADPPFGPQLAGLVRMLFEEAREITG